MSFVSQIPIPEVYNTPGEEQELAHLLKVLSLDDITPEGDFIGPSNLPLIPSSPRLSTSQPSSSKSYRLIGLQTTTPTQEGYWEWPIETIAHALHGHNLIFLPPSPVWSTQPPSGYSMTSNHVVQRTTFIKNNIDTFLPEMFLNQTVYFYNSSNDSHPQQVAVRWLLLLQMILRISTSVDASTRGCWPELY
jgi:hypothetical protein